jgi:hypothetical protein
MASHTFLKEAHGDEITDGMIVCSDAQNLGGDAVERILKTSSGCSHCRMQSAGRCVVEVSCRARWKEKE